MSSVNNIAGEPLTPMTPHTGTDMWEDSQVRSDSQRNTATVYLDDREA